MQFFSDDVVFDAAMHNLECIRTTLNVDDNVLHAARELARRNKLTLGEVISALARRGLQSCRGRVNEPSDTRNAVLLVPSRGDIVTLRHVRRITAGEAD